MEILIRISCFLAILGNRPEMVDIDSDRARSVGIDFHGFRSEPKIDRILKRKERKFDAPALAKKWKNNEKSNMSRSNLIFHIIFDILIIFFVKFDMLH